jgi:hypothetical protein
LPLRQAAAGLRNDRPAALALDSPSDIVSGGSVGCVQRLDD